MGAARVARPIIDVVFDGVADTIDLELEALLGPGPGRYWRLQTALTEASDDLDDASPTTSARCDARASGWPRSGRMTSTR